MLQESVHNALAGRSGRLPTLAWAHTLAERRIVAACLVEAGMANRCAAEGRLGSTVRSTDLLVHRRQISCCAVARGR